MMTVHDLFGTGPHEPFRYLSVDSRTVGEGDVFVALAGGQQHGLAYAQQALNQKAVAVVCDFDEASACGHEFNELMFGDARVFAVEGLRARLGAFASRAYGHPSRQMRMVGITGTSGKTSVVHLMTQWLMQMGVNAGSIGTLGWGVNNQLRTQSGLTTPDVCAVHAHLADMQGEGAQTVAMEVSSHALDQGRVDQVHFGVAAFNNLSRDHLDYHSDMDAYGLAKAKLFDVPSLSHAVINMDDAFGRVLHESLRERRPELTLVGLRVQPGDAPVAMEDGTVLASNVRHGIDGVAFDVHVNGAVHSVQTSLLGGFVVPNVLMAAACLVALGHEWADVVKHADALQTVPGRMQRVRVENDADAPVVLVDYAHKPEALRQALESVRVHVEGRVICVFGCGGDRDAGKRPEMAAIAESLADQVFVTDDNPRQEDGDQIVADIMRGFTQPQQVCVQRDRAHAIADAVSAACAGDVVLIAGKGHERTQEVRGVKYPFDDASVAEQTLTDWVNKQPQQQTQAHEQEVTS